ncbi:MAG: hypothetical protein J1G30_02820 [Spirochaetales bacterium]|nr:hypothetical protein [Spirochaetales bacterium]
MRKQFCLLILCMLIFACDTEKSSGDKDKTNETIETKISSTELQTFTQKSRRVIKGGDKIGEMKEVKQYGENMELKYYAVYDYGQYNKETKSGIVSAILYGDEKKQKEIGNVIYTYNDKTVLMETFDKGERVAAVTEYVEYIDDNFKFYTKYCKYLPSENNKVVYYKISDFNNGTFDYATEKMYFADGLTWNAEEHKPIGDLKILEENTCQYNTTAIPNTDNKQHQWTSEIYYVNDYSESGEQISARKFQYDFIWNEKICKTTHLQQDSFEIDINTNEVSTNDTVRRSFQIFGTEPKIKRKSWISADGETKYYHKYGYAPEPNKDSEYYINCEDIVELSNGIEFIKERKTYCHYVDENGDLIYEESESLGNEPSRSIENSKFDFTLMPERYSRGR